MLSVALWCCLSFQQAAWAAAAQIPTDQPESVVAAFYTWYIKHDADTVFPLLAPDIYKFVSKQTADALRDDYRHDRLPSDVDYFTKVQDFDAQDWRLHIVVRRAQLIGDMAVTAVSLGSINSINVLVFLQKQDGVWRISKVDNMQAYQSGRPDPCSKP
jgi:hypothetical protein